MYKNDKDEIHRPGEMTMPWIPTAGDCGALDTGLANRSRRLAEPSLQFHFARCRWPQGVLWISAAVATFGLGIGLLSRIPEVPSVTNQLLVCAAFMLGIGLFALRKAEHALFGSLVIDAHGIAFRTLLFDRFLPWSHVLEYSVRFSREFAQDSSIILWVTDPQEVYSVFSTHGLSEADHAIIRLVLGLYVPSHRD